MFVFDRQVRPDMFSHNSYVFKVKSWSARALNFLGQPRDTARVGFAAPARCSRSSHRCQDRSKPARLCQRISCFSDLEEPLESLKNMNVQTAKYASWVVRILSPKLIRYTFPSKRKSVEAEKFLFLLVSGNPTQCTIGSVPFTFAAPDTAKKALDRFKALIKPTMISAVPLTDTDTLKGIAGHVDEGMTLTQVLERLTQVSLLQTETLSGTGVLVVRHSF
jgi:hypothetical protein